MPNEVFQFQVLGEQAFQIFVAGLLSLPVAWNRERKTRIMGMRTYPLVAIGSCAFMLIGLSFSAVEDANARARIIQGVITGIGFLGGGAILKNDESVRGTASAASILMVGAIGTAVGNACYEIALLTSVATFFILRYLERWKVDLEGDERSQI